MVGGATILRPRPWVRWRGKGGGGGGNTAPTPHVRVSLCPHPRSGTWEGGTPGVGHVAGGTTPWRPLGTRGDGPWGPLGKDTWGIPRDTRGTPGATGERHWGWTPRAIGGRWTPAPTRATGAGHWGEHTRREHRTRTHWGHPSTFILPHPYSPPAPNPSPKAGGSWQELGGTGGPPPPRASRRRGQARGSRVARASNRVCRRRVAISRWVRRFCRRRAPVRRAAASSPPQRKNSTVTPSRCFWQPGLPTGVAVTVTSWQASVASWWGMVGGGG